MFRLIRQFKLRHEKNVLRCKAQRIGLILNGGRSTFDRSAQQARQKQAANHIPCAVMQVIGQSIITSRFSRPSAPMQAQAEGDMGAGMADVAFAVMVWTITIPAAVAMAAPFLLTGHVLVL